MPSLPPPGMIWLGTFFSPMLPLINVIKLLILMYIRSWAVLCCNIPHDRIFKASNSNAFYYTLLLLMLFLCMLPVLFCWAIISPSKDCGPFAGLEKSFHIISTSLTFQYPNAGTVGGAIVRARIDLRVRKSQIL